MLSRRMLRIKVMQALYAAEMNATLTYSGLRSNLIRSVQQTYSLYLYHFLTFTKVAEYVWEDKKRKSQKFIRTEKDNISTKFLDNSILQALSKDKDFEAQVKTRKLAIHVDPDIIKKLYTSLTNHPSYIAYLENDAPTLKEDKRLMIVLLKKILLKNEVFLAHIEDIFTNWIDDKSAVIASIIGNLNSFEVNHTFPHKFIINQSDWTEKLNFSYDLLRHTFTKEEEYIKLITPKLKNWELERVTLIDTLLLKMALSELMYFPTIPVKVTINEYIEVAKVYSTPKSKDFINGVLDKLLKMLRQEDKIKKLGRGLLD